jgi:hypothetical protein
MTQTTRRTLLRSAAFAVVAAPFLAAPEVLAATTHRALYVRTRFRLLRHKTFRMEGAGRRWRVELTEVGNLSHAQRRDQHAFTLTFRTGSRGPEQGSYVFRRPGFRPTMLFVVPTGEDRRTYEAVIFRKPRRH